MITIAELSSQAWLSGGGWHGHQRAEDPRAGGPGGAAPSDYRGAKAVPPGSPDRSAPCSRRPRARTPDGEAHGDEGTISTRPGHIRREAEAITGGAIAIFLALSLSRSPRMRRRTSAGPVANGSPTTCCRPSVSAASSSRSISLPDVRACCGKAPRTSVRCVFRRSGAADPGTGRLRRSRDRRNGTRRWCTAAAGSRVHRTVLRGSWRPGRLPDPPWWLAFALVPPTGASAIT